MKEKLIKFLAFIVLFFGVIVPIISIMLVVAGIVLVALFIRRLRK